jgi:hypothetical protein
VWDFRIFEFHKLLTITIEPGQGFGTAMIMMVAMVTFDSLRAMNLATAPCVAKLGST